MQNNAFEFPNVFNTWNLGFCILAGSYYEPSSRIGLDFTKVASFPIHGAHLPPTSTFVMAGRYDVLIEARAKLESAGISLQVVYIVER